jgi:ribosome biogenesis GTPase YqeH
MSIFKKSHTTGVTAEIRVRRCYGCGSILQDQDPSEAGYLPPEKFEKGDEELCERCYRLRHYSSFRKIDFNLDYVTILTKAKEEGALAVYVLNAFSLCGSFLEGLGKYLPSNVLVILNKRDVLPEGFSDEYLLAYARRALAKENIAPKEILLTSATNKTGIESLFKKINQYRNGRSAYFFGSYQTGKSSLINSLLGSYTNTTGKTITTSPFPGTTLDVIAIPVDEESYIYDTPGIYSPRSMISFLEPEEVRYILPREPIRPERYGAKEEQSFLLSNMARIDFESGDKTDFTFFKSNDLMIFRCKKSKADKGLQENCDNENLEPRTGKVKSMADLVPTFVEAIDGKRNILRISSLAFVEFLGNGQKLAVYAPKGIKVVLESDEVL